MPCCRCPAQPPPVALTTPTGGWHWTCSVTSTGMKQNASLAQLHADRVQHRFDALNHASVLPLINEMLQLLTWPNERFSMLLSEFRGNASVIGTATTHRLPFRHSGIHHTYIRLRSILLQAGKFFAHRLQSVILLIRLKCSPTHT